MSIRLELQCINQEDPSTDDCYSMNEQGVFETADDTQADLIRAYKYLQDLATRKGWKAAKLAQGKKGMLCPNCVKLYEAQTGHILS
ncbi:hypothetical protein OFL75_19240 [Pseudomonas aeruginosa]|jgi:hypothetical protein|uniref:Uncharacterized protein n=6 Tax=Pseudomonas TaxID=286 RepID=A0A2K4XIN1_PSEAI|nr:MULTISPECIES: hypothetical protein [Pseudomonas]AVX92838.1 hypothetical protein PkP19E3_32370 [Pseudomonas koreensis]AGL46386.1 hypothetical protein pOZ176_428 [Pseudomonas aeruginosa PA96]AJA17234.1 hypothetical protein RPPX_28330 [Pseudomonas putida S12]ALZ46273.1 Hypothetical protein [Pseudomonas putida]ANI18830.1 hypothetical protein A9C11_32770 [Pseudomonas citronellolis]